MYSLILMAAVAAGPDQTSFGGRLWGGCNGCTGAPVASCTGCTGCTGVPVASCTGCTGCTGYSTCHGCYSSCNGCSGGGLFGGHFKRKASACWGTSISYSCLGSCYGSSCWGSSCYGSACWGSCYGSSCYGSACWGSCYGSSYSVSCYGCTGCTGCTGYYPGTVVIPQVGTATTAPAADLPAPKEKESGSAKLTFELPADAKLFVDGQVTKGTGASRTFHTPTLPGGQKFFYEFKAEFVVNGKTQVEEKKVVVMAGDALTETFSKLLAAESGKGDPLATASK